MHDYGKLKLDPQIVQKPLFELTYEEKKELERHPIIGMEILSSMNKVPDEVFQIVGQHHENCNGTGYPDKLHRSAIHPFAKLIGLSNEFVNQMSHIDSELKTEDRYYEALKKIVLLKSHHFETDYLEKLLSLYNFSKDLHEHIKNKNE